MDRRIGLGIMKLWPLAAVVSSGVIAFMVGLQLSQRGAGALSTGMLAATLVAILWYTVETRELRLHQAFDNEIRHHPWLKGSDLKVTRDTEEGGLVGRDIVYLPITNVGITPAHDLRIKVRWQVKGEQPSEDSKEIADGDLAPGDTCHAKLCEIDFEAPGDRAEIVVEISYKSFMGGGGQLTMGFYSPESGGWVNRQTSPYQFWLADGRRFPKQVSSRSDR